MALDSSLARLTRAVLSLALATAMIVAVAVVVNSAGPTTTSNTTTPVNSPSGVLTPAPASLLHLPPSHDNDAGHSRIIDTTPDADVDWYQSHP